MAWPFRKKTPQATLSINRNFYVSVLSSPPQLPPLLQVCNPDGSNGAVRGYAIPLKQGASKDLLNEPMTADPFGFSTLDKKTVLQLDVFERSGIEFKVPVDEHARNASGLVGLALTRANEASYVSTLIFKGYDPSAYSSIRFFIDIAKRFGALTDAVIADPLAETYRLPESWSPNNTLAAPLDFREIGTIKAVELEDGVWVSTRGLAKFNMPEFEMYGVPRELVDTAAIMAISAAQQALIGIPMREGETAFSTATPLKVVPGTRNRNAWGDRPAYELRDVDGTGAARGVEAWSKSQI